MESAKKEQDPSMEDILKTIRNVISGEVGEAETNAEDVLELTDMITEDGAVVNLKNCSSGDGDHSHDVLDNIDHILNNEHVEAEAENEVEPKEEHPYEETEEPREADSDEPEPQPMPEEDSPENDTPLVNETSTDTESELPASPPPPTNASVDEDMSSPPSDTPTDNAEKHDPEQAVKQSRLISVENAAASAQPLKALLKTVSKAHADGLPFRSGTTVEDLVIEILKPQLSEWLNQNLPALVKHVVEKEIKKLIPRDDD